MSVALRLYEQLTEAGEDKTRAKLIAEAFEQFEERYPNLKDIATQGHVREIELRLQKKIKEVEERLQKEIKELNIKLKEAESRLKKGIKDIEIKLQQAEVRLVTAIHRQIYWVIGSVGIIIGFIRFLDWLLASLPRL
jgi:SMC interacting uncharacterized protein involved in chromosome segregation